MQLTITCRRSGLWVDSGSRLSCVGRGRLVTDTQVWPGLEVVGAEVPCSPCLSHPVFFIECESHPVFVRSAIQFSNNVLENGQKWMIELHLILPSSWVHLLCPSATAEAVFPSTWWSERTGIQGGTRFPGNRRPWGRRVQGDPTSAVIRVTRGPLPVCRPSGISETPIPI